MGSNDVTRRALHPNDRTNDKNKSVFWEMVAPKYQWWCSCGFSSMDLWSNSHKSTKDNDDDDDDDDTVVVVVVLGAAS